MTFIAGLIIGAGLLLIIDMRARSRVAKLEASLQQKVMGIVKDAQKRGLIK